ncbi:MAG: hypothetical protein ACR2JG_13250 [Geodermatophilaceae bacterium]
MSVKAPDSSTTESIPLQYSDFAINSAYRPTGQAPPRTDFELSATSIEEVAELAVASGDEHAIKFVEVVQESHWRGNNAAVPSGARAVALIEPD